MQSTTHRYIVSQSKTFDKIEATAKKALPRITYTNVSQRTFTRNAYPLRTCPKKIATIFTLFFTSKSSQTKKEIK